MQRKTNLFYSQGADSNFITFSNYTESLTGNFLATDWKLFPSAFMCLYIPKLNKDNKADFIKYLIASYENKLAYMRDLAIAENKSIENLVYPLEWLIESLFNSSEEYLEDIEIRYVSDITEHNYNGVYADTICTIDGTEKPKMYTIKEAETQVSDDVIVYNANPGCLYGWYLEDESNNLEYTGPSEFENLTPVFYKEDDQSKYYGKYPKYNKIEVREYTNNEGPNSIEFNVIIPLFSIVNVNTNTDTVLLSEESNIVTITDQYGNIEDTYSVINLGTSEENKVNIPLGVWFADETVKLNRDVNNNYAPAWSLILSSQFKPLPYSKSLLNDTVADVYNANAYQTFAQVLTRQNELLDMFNVVNDNIARLNNRIESLETRINNIGTRASIDDLHIEMVNFKNEIRNILSNFTEDKGNGVIWESKF